MVIDSPSWIRAIGAAHIGFRRNVADHHAPGAAGKAAVGDQAHAFAQPLADDAPRSARAFPACPVRPSGPS